MVLKVVPFDAGATAAQATQSMVADRNPATVRRALDDARSAFARGPTVVSAVTASAIALGLQGRQDASLRAFRYSQELSRRDVQTQLALIEHQVAGGNIVGALEHYDTILRSSDRIKSILFPILTNASADPAIARQLNLVLRRKPNWWREYLTWFLGASSNPMAIALLPRAVLDPDVDEDRTLILRQLQLLAQAERYDLLWSTYQRLGVADAAPMALLRDGNFEGNRGFPPVDWHYAETGELSPERRQLDAGPGSALYLPMEASSHGKVAEQLLRLSSGTYEFRAETGDVPSDPARRPFVRVSCAGAGQRVIMRHDFPRGDGEGGIIVARFDVPRSCPYQWLSIFVRGGLDEALAEPPWIAALSLRQL
ncbi:hypothetical protein RCO27_13460 [Sphingosinicella sp. LHD-64]|uniref:hypothetical protein n=1 Tax=Sphingosinicella sp. LHD-64 TaxID=3072139 RepID=UPI00280D6082|nr:hypothetical protein [Sphingosinicella sp. LHD-64]MDQ8757234.1 hypothetical protein [Sphingosinicella sp. LHD-64]